MFNTHKQLEKMVERDPNLTKFNETRTTTKEWLEKSMSKWEIRSEFHTF